jgi:DNA-binding response OmpR family regulator
LTILVAENDEPIRSQLRTFLSRAGYRVLEAADGVRAVRLVAEEHIDALLLAVTLGGDDGVALGHELRLDRPDSRSHLSAAEERPTTRGSERSA